MIYIDMFFLAVVSFSVAMGCYRGLIWELFKYVGFIAGIALAFFVILKTFHIFSSSDYVFLWIISVGAFVFLLTSSVILYFLKKFLTSIRVASFALSDRIFGGLFGFVRAGVFITLLNSTLMLMTLNQKPDWLKESVITKYLDASHEFVEGVLKRNGGPKLHKLLKLDKMVKLSTYI